MSFEDTDPQFFFDAATENTEPGLPTLADARVPCQADSRPFCGGLRPCGTLPGLGEIEWPELRPFEATVTALPFDGRLAPVRGIAYEVEHRGIFVHGRNTLPVGTLVRLRISTDVGCAAFTARVVQSVHRFGFGCKFVDLDSDERIMLSLFVASANSAPKKARTLH